MSVELAYTIFLSSIEPSSETHTYKLMLDARCVLVCVCEPWYERIKWKNYVIDLFIVRTPYNSIQLYWRAKEFSIQL